MILKTQQGNAQFSHHMTNNGIVMKSQRLSIFCLSKELQEWTYVVCKQHDLSLLVFKTFEQGDIIQPGVIDFESHWKRVFLFPKDNSPISNIQFNDLRPIESHWIDIQPGGLFCINGQQIIRLTEICAKGENSKSNMWKAIATYKKLVQRNGQAGVSGKNEKLGGKDTYRNIWHTSQAREKYSQGILWKQQPECNVTFSPIMQETETG